MIEAPPATDLDDPLDAIERWALHTFGASAPAPVLYERFGIIAAAVVKQARALLQP